MAKSIVLPTLLLFFAVTLAGQNSDMPTTLPQSSSVDTDIHTSFSHAPIHGAYGGQRLNGFDFLGDPGY